MTKYILSIDQGTTGTTVSLVDQKGRMLDRINEEFEQIYPQPGWVEHNPEKIWQSFVKATEKLFQKSSVCKSDIVGIGITNQRETTVLWDKKTGKAVYNAIVWQCRRTTDVCEKLKKKKMDKLIFKRTGLVLDPYFSATKIQWILKNVAAAKTKAKNSELLFGTMDTYLLWRLTRGLSHKTDVSNASRTMLMNLKTGNWDEELLKLFKVPQSILPEITFSSGEFGKTRGVSFLPDGIPITGIAGDQQAALFGQTCFASGDAKCTYGTGSFILMNTGQKLIRSKAKLLTTVAWQLENEKKMTYALEGGAFICGAAVQWLRDGLQIIEKSSDVEVLAKQVKDSGGVEFVPGFVGLGAPYWDPEVRGLISGISRGTNRFHLARATIEAMALQNVDILRAMEKDLGRKLKRLRVDGGACANNILLQLQSDYLGTMIDRPQSIETTALGAAFLSGLGVGLWSDTKEIEKVWKTDREFVPQLKPAERKKRYDFWQQAIQRSQGKKVSK